MTIVGKDGAFKVTDHIVEQKTWIWE